MSLKESEVIPYWKERVSKNGATAVGFDAKDINKQNKRYHERRLFINPYLNKDLFTLDYGCGIGRYASLFKDDKYTGADIMIDLIYHAVASHSKKNFCHLNYPYLSSGFENKIEQIFTATVLQHNCVEVITDIFKSFFLHIPNHNIRFVFYEKCDISQPNKPHVKNLHPQLLSWLLEEAGYSIVSEVESHDHNIHNENHSLSIITTC